nr:F-box only protein 32-like [Ciona intestinalis]|eukprot:XP_002121684.1 F-box only protein 32-like [Ciona intestinalis]
MPFIGQDWRGPGYIWNKSGTSTWDICDRNIGVHLESVPRSQVKKIIEAFLRQMQEKKCQTSYTNLTSAPVSKCSVKENMTWLQVSSTGSKECRGYTTFGELIRRLDLAGAAALPHRFPYILKIAELVVRHKMSTLSGMAQSHFFLLIEALLEQVLERGCEIRRMRSILNRLMFLLQRQSRRTSFSSKLSWFQCIETVRIWQSKLKRIEVTRRFDNRATLTDLPLELQYDIIAFLNEAEDVNAASKVCRTLHMICEQPSIWKNLCYKNFTQEQVDWAIAFMIRKIKRNQKVEEGSSSLDQDYFNINSASKWMEVHALLHKAYVSRELIYVDPLLHCQRCSVLFWKDTGHPCIESDNSNVIIDQLSPRKFISFFDD